MSDYIQLPPISQLQWALIDLDGTLARATWTPENPTHHIGDPIAANVTKALKLAEQGWKIVIHTARPWADYANIEAWCEWNGIPTRRIVCGKLLGGVMIDDRNVDISSPDWADPEGAKTQAWYEGYMLGYKDGVRVTKAGAQ